MDTFALTRMCRLPDARNESTPPAKEVHSVGRALDIVEALARSDHELGVSEVAGVTGLAPGTTTVTAVRGSVQGTASITVQ